MWMEKMSEKMSYKLEVQLKDNKYPYFDSKNLNLTGIGFRTKGRIIYISGRFVITKNNEKFVEFRRIHNIAVVLSDAKMMRTEQGTLVIKYEPNSTLYLIEIPSGFRGSVETQVLSGECVETTVLRSPAGSLGYVDHIWCNGDAEIKYKITGRTGTAGYGNLINLFGDNLSGIIKIKNNKVEIIYDEQLDQLLI